MMHWSLVLVPAALALGALLFPVPRRAFIMICILIRRFIPRIPARLRLFNRSYTRARALRLAFEDLGPAYIKFGQMIASSPSAFPEEVTQEFVRCLDRVRPVPYSVIKRTIEDSLGRPMTEIFSEFNEEPLASASIAQVHTARTKDFHQVVVKVQRPGIRKIVAQDLGLMAFGAKLVEKRWPELQRANLSGIVADFRKTIVEEIDFRREAKNMDDFTGLLEREGLTTIAAAPKVYHELSNKTMITMERLSGVRIDDKLGVDSRVEDAKSLLVHSSQVFWTSVFLGGFFHGDIHAGNILVLDDGRLGYLDFGIFGRFDMNERLALLDWVGALSSGNSEQLAISLKKMGAVPPTVEWQKFVADVDQIFMPMRAITVDKPEMAMAFFPKLRRMARHHDMHLPQNFVLILKQLSYFGRYVMLHNPSFNENLDPQTQRIFFSLFSKFHALRKQEENKDNAPRLPKGRMDADNPAQSPV
jgi:predicted unusual protein kinase regulating ubiquinone biosynthesis (AarF/ABC1/UbiB family)